MPQQIEFRCQIVKRQQPNASFVILTFASPEIASLAMPGQFVNISADKFLRRPIGIMSVDREQGLFSVGIRIQGEGTLNLSVLQPGHYVSLLGPLGHGFKLDNYDRVITVGGGTGVFPLFFVQQYCQEHGIEGIAVCGYRSAAESILTEEFTKTACAVSFASDAGDMTIAGHAGHALAAVIADLIEKKADLSRTLIAACGPKIMMRTAAEQAAAAGISCQVSLEERMACGVGVCLVCVCKTKGSDGEIENSRCCADGPVFDAEAVVW
ncbi:MAG: dihydroorotate dehydrogenase electron transfer subunit [Clostridiales bacterium]|nr:dihydroorotate dehydrogenase electron transfer subunit [Eubacteriales bacterium]MDD4681599.1 dihydroorotate dehydrogenase electron transfer subunit [Eubacteriales bacterium]MDN5314221.1 dihydroorotate dehydrogenase electron transfer subunit [Clostridiales bacterium]